MATRGKRNLGRTIGVAAMLGLIGCGGVGTSDVVSARNQATTASCNYFQMCNQIGAGLSYDTYSDCMTQVLGQWTSGWPTDSCQGHIDQSQLTVCLDAINSTLCSNGLDVLSTLLLKCPEAKVCGAGVPPDAGTD